MLCLVCQTNRDQQVSDSPSNKGGGLSGQQLGCLFPSTWEWRNRSVLHDVSLGWAEGPLVRGQDWMGSPFPSVTIRLWLSMCPPFNAWVMKSPWPLQPLSSSLPAAFFPSTSPLHSPCPTWCNRWPGRRSWAPTGWSAQCSWRSWLWWSLAFSTEARWR